MLSAMEKSKKRVAIVTAITTSSFRNQKLLMQLLNSFSSLERMLMNPGATSVWMVHQNNPDSFFSVSSHKHNCGTPEGRIEKGSAKGIDTPPPPDKVSGLWEKISHPAQAKNTQLEYHGLQAVLHTFSSISMWG